MSEIKVSTPSRLCLFGEHLDYLGLQVIAVAINLRFSAKVVKNSTSLVNIKIRDSKIDTLGESNDAGLYDEYSIDLSKPIVYENNRDYLKSSINILLKRGYSLEGFDIVMDSEIPIGKGMCSSSTMIVVLIKALLTGIGHEDAQNPEKIAYLAYLAEVEEFGEPGGMMDHFTSAMGGLVNIDFADGKTTVNALDQKLEGSFILFDSLDQKDTTRVLANAKTPALEAIEKLSGYGITSVRDFENEDNMKLLEKLDGIHKKVLSAAIDNYKILLEAKKMLSSDKVDNVELGKLISRHHANLRDGLNISTEKIETILNKALEHGAWGGKVNGSGGGGCLYVYAANDKCDKIIEEVAKLGYPGKVIRQDTGVRRDA